MPDQHTHTHTHTHTTFQCDEWTDLQLTAASAGLIIFPQTLTPTHQLSENRRVNGSVDQSVSSNKRSTIRNESVK